MTSGIVRPTGSTNSGCTITGAATAHEAVDEVTLDTADYILFDTSGDYVYLTFPVVSGDAADTVILEADIVAQTVSDTMKLNVTLVRASGADLSAMKQFSVTTTQKTFHFAAPKLTGEKLAAGWKLLLRMPDSGDNIQAFQVFVRYKYCPTASLATVALRPDADLTHGFLCSAGSTEWNLIDEETADDTDYIYDTANSLSKWSLAVPAHKGQLLYVAFALRTKASASMTANNYVKLYDAAGNAILLFDNAASISLTRGSITSWNAVSSNLGGVKSTGELLEWADIDNAALEDNVTISGGTFYISWAEVTAYYEQVDYWDDSVPVILPVVGYGFQVQVTLGANCPTLSKVQVQASTDPAFATTDYDSGELDSSADALDVLSLIGSHTFTAAGTYYVRVGARNSTDTVMTWSLVGSFVVNFPTAPVMTVTHKGSHYTITVTLDDSYKDPPELMATIDGQTYKGQLQ